jgi:hypothetical protein
MQSFVINAQCLVHTCAALSLTTCDAQLWVENQGLKPLPFRRSSTAQLLRV